MFRHHLLLIFRNFKRYKASFFINLIGLSAGLSCALLIYLWVSDELQMDKFHAKYHRLYQVMENEKTEKGIRTIEETQGPLAEALLKEMPEVENAVAVSPSFWLEQSMVSVRGGARIKAGGKFAGKEFFNVFSYPLISGNPGNVLSGKHTIVISESLALKLFHTTEVLGKEMTWGNIELKNESHVLISGVFKDTPANSSDQFDFLVPMDNLFETAPNYLSWGNLGPSTFVLLKQGADQGRFNEKIRNFVKSKGQNFHTLFIRPYGDAYLYNRYENGQLAGGRIDYVYLFSLIAVFILLIACINFMNLSTAKATRRLKEVGIKKVMGANRASLTFQYLIESVLLSFLSLFIALLVVELLLPRFNAITDKQLTLIFNGKLMVSLLVITITTGLVSGSYPAFYLSKFNPADALKGKLNVSSAALLTRKALVVFQFSLSVILIVAVLVIYKQIEFVQTKNIGYKKDNVIFIEAQGRLKDHIRQAITTISQLPGVSGASGIDHNFLSGFSFTFGDFSWEGRNPKEVIKFYRANVGDRFMETMGMEMVSGRSFSSRFGADSSNMVINETGIRVMQLKNPVGKIFRLWGKDYQIIGVVRDFNFESLHEPVKPMFFRYDEVNTNRIAVKIESGKEQLAIAAIKKFNKDFNPGYLLDYRFLDQDFQIQYVSENRVAALSKYFAFLAILLSCLGLFGLASFTAERRLREIGIRKVLGATEFSIIYILAKDFTRPVVVAIMVALPLSYIFTKYWLETFAYRIELNFWYFATAGLLALFISLATVVIQAIKAASINPIQCIRAE